MLPWKLVHKPRSLGNRRPGFSGFADCLTDPSFFFSSEWVRNAVKLKRAPEAIGRRDVTLEYTLFKYTIVWFMFHKFQTFHFHCFSFLKEFSSLI